MNPWWLVIACALFTAEPRSDSSFRITVVDEQTGRGVPLIELHTVHALSYVTDSTGVVAFDEPGLMDQPVFFSVRGHGYEFPKDGFGFRGRRLTTQRGGAAILKIRRLNIAERLYRITGAGRYVHSERTGLAPPFPVEPVNARVLGSDSVQAIPFRGSIHWFWGDTQRASYPLGNFHVPGATSPLPSAGGLDPSVGVPLQYFVGPDGFAKETCRMPGDGPTWLDGIAVVRDREGRERLFGHYVKVRPPLTISRHGLAEFLPDQQAFEPRYVFDEDAVVPTGHSFTHREKDGAEYLYFAKPLSLVRVRATAEALLDPSQWEAYTGLEPGRRTNEPILDRDEQGQVRFGWKRHTSPWTIDLQRKLTAAGPLAPEEGLFHVRDAETGKPILIHHGGINWNPWRKRWVLIASQSYGASFLGEVWYAEADAPVGPWAYARKIVTHDKQSFYNPRHHAFFDQDEGRVLYFEGTYTHTFSGNEERTPRYDYNQIMYRLDLADPRLILPVAIYRHSAAVGEVLRRGSADLPVDGTVRQVAFFAVDRPLPGMVPLRSRQTTSGFQLAVGTAEETPAEDASADPPLAYAYPVESESRPAWCVPLYEYAQPASGQRKYVAGGEELPGWQRGERPIAYVWPRLPPTSLAAN